VDTTTVGGVRFRWREVAAVLLAYGPSTAEELSVHLGIEQGTAERLVRRMERAGLLEADGADVYRLVNPRGWR
jgi:DNA-binding IclR family transcriptional regulator